MMRPKTTLPRDATRTMGPVLVEDCSSEVAIPSLGLNISQRLCIAWEAYLNASRGLCILLEANSAAALACGEERPGGEAEVGSTVVEVHDDGGPCTGDWVAGAERRRGGSNDTEEAVKALDDSGSQGAHGILLQGRQTWELFERRDSSGSAPIGDSR